ncbi:MAG: hypothetical protein WCO16_03390 [bacterium]
MLNYIGQLRIYSLIDLVILLIATKANIFEFVGIILLHIGFLAYLETKHHHPYRNKVPKYLWIILTIIGLYFYGHIEGILFVIFSYLYTLKTKKFFALTSPIMRGFQCFFLVAGIIGYESKLTWLALMLIIIRNFCGDLRDVVKDRKENMKTLPVVFGLNTDIKYIHLAVLFLTTFVWFRHTNLEPWLLIPIFLIQILTYRLTPR